MTTSRQIMSRGARTLEDYYIEGATDAVPYTTTKDWKRAGEVVARAFQKNSYNLFVTQHCSIEQNIADFQHRCQELVENNTLILEADDFAAVAVWIPPEWDYYPYPDPIDPNLRFAEDAFHQCAEKFFKGGPFWHLTMLAKDPLRPEVKGATSKVMKPVLEDAKRRNIPAALECIDERAREIYEYYGFKTYEIITVGAGKCNPQGYEEKGGQGIKVYYMIYNYDPKVNPVL